MRAAAFVDSLGVGTQLGNAGNTDATRVDGMLDYLGIGNVRQNAPGDVTTSALMIDLGKRGAKFDIIINGNGPVNLKGVLDTIATYKPYLNAVEGPNEVDIFPIYYTDRQAYGFEGAMRLQEDLYNALRADRSYDAIDIYTFSLANVLPSTDPLLRDMSAFADFASVHSYSPNGIRPAWVIPYGIAGFDDIASRDPAVLTETGFYTLPGHRSWGGVTENVQAEYVLDTLFGNAMRGVDRTYLFNLIDQPDPHNSEREAHFGMFRADGSAKPVANALHNVTTILADNGVNAGSFATSEVSYSVSGLPFTQASMQFQKSNGTHIIAVWNEEDLWDEVNGTEIASPHYNATIKLDRDYDTVHVYDPMLDFKPIATLRNVSSVTTDVSSHPVLIQLGSGLPGAAPVMTTPVPTTPVPAVPIAASPAAPPSTTLDTLAVTVSQDAWQGDAQFIVRVDGVQVGGTNTTTALHAQGANQTFSFTGDWPDGAHKVSVSFINDAYGGTATMDRNLYVEKVTFNGAVATPSSAVALHGPDTADFSVGSTGKTLLLRMSEDAWQGHAQFVVKVDGVQVGGTNTVTAQRSEGKTQDFSFTGDWADGTHKVSVEFLNDSYGGSPGTDRNLYVEGLGFGSASHSGAVIYSGGADFNIFG